MSSIGVRRRFSHRACGAVFVRSVPWFAAFTGLNAFWVVATLGNGWPISLALGVAQCVWSGIRPFQVPAAYDEGRVRMIARTIGMGSAGLTTLLVFAFLDLRQ
jgi:hypothetical protein